MDTPDNPTATELACSDLRAIAAAVTALLEHEAELVEHRRIRDPNVEHAANAAAVYLECEAPGVLAAVAAEVWRTRDRYGTAAPMVLLAS
jgi:hypothetical protein